MIIYQFSYKTKEKQEFYFYFILLIINRLYLQKQQNLIDVIYKQKTPTIKKNHRLQITSMQLKHEMKSQQSRSQDDNHTSPSTSTIRYLRDRRANNQIRKSSVADSEIDRPNFCFNMNITNAGYSVMRTYIDAISSNKVKLYYTKFTPNVKKGQICILHGYGQNSDDYLTIAQYFAKRGYVINMVDLRGFGYSGGERVNQPTRKVLLDIETLLRTCCQRDLPTFIIAHGLGALFLNALLQQNNDLPISGIINLTPLIKFTIPNKNFLFENIFLKIFPNIFGDVLIHNMINPTNLSKDPFAIKAKIQSCFWESFITYRMAGEYARVGDKVRAQAYRFVYPTLFCCGGLDTIQSLDEVRKYYNSISSQDKQIIVFKQGYHQLQNDHEADQLMLRMYNWIETRKNKIKWKQTKPFNRDRIVKINRFWIKFGLIMGFILFLIAIVRTKLFKRILLSVRKYFKL